MAGLARLLAAAALVLAFAGAAQAATDIRINPIPPQVQPQWTPVPNAPGVDWAPNIPTDVFRHGTSYYFYWEGFIFQGSSPSGPWQFVGERPAWFSEIDPSYFKTIQTKQPAGSAGPAPVPTIGAPVPAPVTPKTLPRPRPCLLRRGKPPRLPQGPPISLR